MVHTKLPRNNIFKTDTTAKIKGIRKKKYKVKLTELGIKILADIINQNATLTELINKV